MVHLSLLIRLHAFHQDKQLDVSKKAPPNAGEGSGGVPFRPVPHRHRGRATQHDPNRTEGWDRIERPSASTRNVTKKTKY